MLSGNTGFILILLAGVFALVACQYGYPEPRVTDSNSIDFNGQTFDVIVIGSGSAGSIVAGKVAGANRNISVLLLEAGDVDNKAEIFCPSFFGSSFLNDELTFSYWGEESEAPSLFSRFHTRGKVLGGCSSTNVMIYQRGQKNDYDKINLPGWSWNEVLPHFKSMETNLGHNLTASAHGTSGPHIITDGYFQYPITDLWLKTLRDAGIPFDNDHNDGVASGYRRNQVNIKDGYRVSYAESHLKSQATRPANFRIQVNAHVDKLLFHGNKAKSVVFIHRGNSYKVHARRQIVVSAGVFGSVEILQRSGVGPKYLLRSLGIPVVQNLPGVGKNLQDHILVGKTVNVSDTAKAANPNLFSFEDVLASDASVAEWFANRTGALSSNVNEVGVFIRSPFAADSYSDILIQYAPLQYILHGFEMHPGGGLSWGPTLLNPKSRGYVKIKSKDPFTQAIVNHKYLSHPQDLETLIWAVNYTRNLVDNSVHYSGIIDKELVPGVNVRTREQLADYIRHYMMGDDHSCCTNKMGPAHDPMAVLDNKLRVRGLQNLRVCDLSSFPNVIGACTNAPAALVGSKCAEYILNELVN